MYGNIVAADIVFVIDDEDDDDDSNDDDGGDSGGGGHGGDDDDKKRENKKERRGRKRDNPSGELCYAAFRRGSCLPGEQERLGGSTPPTAHARRQSVHGLGVAAAEAVGAGPGR